MGHPGSSTVAAAGFVRYQQIGVGPKQAARTTGLRASASKRGEPPGKRLAHHPDRGLADKAHAIARLSIAEHLIASHGAATSTDPQKCNRQIFRLHASHQPPFVVAMPTIIGVPGCGLPAARYRGDRHHLHAAHHRPAQHDLLAGPHRMAQIAAV